MTPVNVHDQEYKYLPYLTEAMTDKTFLDNKNISKLSMNVGTSMITAGQNTNHFYCQSSTTPVTGILPNSSV